MIWVSRGRRSRLACSRALCSRASSSWIGEVPVELSVVGRNLTDVRGRNHLAFNKEEVLLPGRSIRFGLRARF